jgi:hypothetical protein
LASGNIYFKSIKVNSKASWLFFILLLLSSPLFSQDLEEGIYSVQSNTLLANQKMESLSIFEERSKLKVDIETNLEKIYESLDDPEKQKATLTMHLGDSVKIIKKIKIQVRGNTRKELCDVPPFKIDLDKSDFLDEWFGEVTSLKIVTTCAGSEKYETYLHNEYLMYEIYRIISDFSYRVRLIELTLKDSKNIREDISGYAFFIENDKSVSARTEMTEIELGDTNVSNLLNAFYLNPNEQSLYHMTLLSLYQYMMGNTDWNIGGLHNLKAFTDLQAFYAIPYDFDYAGFVNADYALPSKSVPIKNVRERYYQGPTCDIETFEKALDLIVSKEMLIDGIIDHYPYLDFSEKNDLKRYLNGFFKEASKREEFFEKISSLN